MLSYAFSHLLFITFNKYLITLLFRKEIKIVHMIKPENADDIDLIVAF